jgi:predicted SAM-dependent methyltransferase
MSIIKKIAKKVLPYRLIDTIVVIQQHNEKVKRKRFVTEKKIEALLKSSLPINLELGAGQDRGIEGWTSVDMNDKCDLNLDLTRPLPFPNNSVNIIYFSHVLEHFKYSDLVKLLGECLRILKPGGKFSAAVPNARIYIEAYHDPDNFNPDLFCRYKPAYNFNSKIDYVNYMAYMDGHHQYMFDEENIIVILKNVGFREVKLRDFDKTLDLEVRDFQSIYVQAEK